MLDVKLTINNKPCQLFVDANETLLDTLRDRQHLTGTKRGCDTGDCGACTVLMDGEPVNACLVLTVEADGAKVQTIEGIRHPIQEEFCKQGAFQCGFCAPGAIASTIKLLEDSPSPTDQEVKSSLAGNLCRCTGYSRILRAIKGEEDPAAVDHTSTGHAPDGFSVVGKPVRRKDIDDKIHGKAAFTADLYFPNMVYGALVESTQPHARITSIDAQAAREMPGVVLVIEPPDVPDTPYGVSPARYDETVLPKDTVRHVGEPVAAVFATDRRTAQLAAQTVRVQYETLPAVFEPEKAVQEGAPQIHERYEHNLNTVVDHDFGDVEDAFESAHYVREDTFHGHRTHQAFLEPHASLAIVQGDMINLWTANQTPHYVQYNVARVLGIPMSKLRVIKPAMGGGFGGKAEATKLDFLSIIAAQKLDRPVLMAYNRKQVFHQGRGRHGQTITLKSAFSKEGKLLGTHETVTLDGGAYTSYGIITTYYSGSLLTTPYNLPNFRFNGRRVVTNLPACGAQRGNGTPYPRFAFESHLDIAAKDLGLDPASIRRINLMESGHTTVNNLQITSCGIKECLEEVVSKSRYNEKAGKLAYGKGIGLGLGCFISGAGDPIVRGDLPHSALTIRVLEDGKGIVLYTGAPEIGQGSDTILCQMVAESLGLDYNDVSIISSDSAVTPKDLGAYASRVTFMAGNAAVDAAEKLKKVFVETWTAEFGPPGGDLVFKNGTVTDGVTSFPFHELAVKYRVKNGPMSATGSYSTPELGGKHKGASVGTSPAYSFCAVAAEVEVDIETGKVRVLRFHAAHDSGTVINPVTFHGQVEGALVMGMGETLMEEVIHDNGVLRNPNFHDYLMPTVADAPEIHCYTVPVKDPNGPFGAKEVGEGTILPVMGSIANAVDDAVGVRIKSLPITAEAVYRAMKHEK
ncbi:MAG: molybdopterin-dependent oxidoreductase [bacterium]|nr:molybdopterin-dependent oxidoreductase [bacterium]